MEKLEKEAIVILAALSQLNPMQLKEELRQTWLDLVNQYEKLVPRQDAKGRIRQPEKKVVAARAGDLDHLPCQED